ncbi:aspartate/glutamate racemase family protein [Haloechinothrix sp. YIM 98757]|uniref:Aspartate/glutamate racemase family protein n=1 Tax=Haloechinothrix aidingensis TaxID=2752311 RepID=A0A838A778_9PSEU|nr:amino acid racemase [Haloechinothrix aidingensis]MBA0123932.1 aspartate/glutamate racemase family protein [Haloechinothrix aidingensis]
MHTASASAGDPGGTWVTRASLDTSGSTDKRLERRVVMSPLLGVLGGMGPAAANSFLASLVEHTPAGRDQDHIATIVYSDPETPDRSDAILAGGPSPVPAMRRGIEFLDRSGCDLIAIPCNTAHQWFDELAAAGSTPILHIVDAVLTRITHDAPQAGAVGILATDGTIHSGIYQRRLAASGHSVLDLTDLGADNPVMAGIRAVKAGELDHARAYLTKAAEMLVTRGAQGLVFGCTDVAAALGATVDGVDVPVWDSSEALAIACIDRIRPDRPDQALTAGEEARENR